MAQYLKDEVQENIAAAALTVFARKGYESATMAEIARAARISTGNIYRYYENKDALFYAVVDEGFARSFTLLLRRRVKALDGVDDMSTLAPAAAYHLAAEELLRFCIENRLRVVILLGRAGGSRYERFAEDTVQSLIQMALDHFRCFRPHLEVTETMRFNLNQIYRSFLGTMVSALESFEEEAALREAIHGYSKYHLAGLRSFFA
ncbi:TetR family transcriptional regulator [Sorangium cellulosum]|uniref:TetR family transcriptional regulator n=1 Tax=Sorangium cellulosum TaxID=56 RepID=A0A2L0F2G3_SORCE|nr:TetR/AcrR family transcriptional regulator [Sorangium cellulosum]AUX45768.1 TetR family transcriptional regulator [Sorangium cellulosum]